MSEHEVRAALTFGAPDRDRSESDEQDVTGWRRVYNYGMSGPQIGIGVPAVYVERRARLAQLMRRGVAVVPTAPEQTRNRDSHYPYRRCGRHSRDPDSVLDCPAHRRGL